ncbi:NAD(P)H-quinone oxidoreductase [Rhodobacteraceae bacterium RKSG542]|uniref:NAD(P)H-quinone oxidoreductase n=1 Tax=Pseudovibrio flavus TaxID=2529854 RepID=UPI0012BC9BFA|nr:NAD(P)H-quinone oxidoreductase [Pseudovibrio flavus]MTI16578.1 NAD(P)H-quinone oxidoreductase [Pseudovibrio flavus]
MSENGALMRVVAISEAGAPEVLKVEERVRPTAGAGEIVIEVHAAGVNRPDVMQRKGLYPAPKDASDLPGLEVAGVVAAVGAGVSEHKVGDEVLALAPGGGYAEYCVVPASNALPIPKGLSMIEAAGVAETFFTVWSNVFDRLGLKAGEKFLVHGGSSGIGTTAIQLAKAFGAEVFTTVGSDDKATAVRDLGADHVINYRTAVFEDVILEVTGGKGVDVILDMVGGDYVERNWKAAAMDGRIGQLATLNGIAQNVNFARLMMKRLTHTGSTLRPRSAEFKGEIAKSLQEKVWPLFEQGRIKVLVDQVFPLEEAAAAHTLMESSNHVGKIILKLR